MRYRHLRHDGRITADSSSHGEETAQEPPHGAGGALERSVRWHLGVRTKSTSSFNRVSRKPPISDAVTRILASCRAKPVVRCTGFLSRRMVSVFNFPIAVQHEHSLLCWVEALISCVNRCKKDVTLNFSVSLTTSLPTQYVPN